MCDYGLHTLQGEYPLLIASFLDIPILLFHKYLQPSLWYLLPFSVIYTSQDVVVLEDGLVVLFDTDVVEALELLFELDEFEVDVADFAKYVFN